MSSLGKRAQIAMAQSIARSQRKSPHTWQIRIATPGVAASVLEQAQSGEELVPISPTVEIVSEREARYSGLNIMAGDIKLTIPANLKRLDGVTPLPIGPETVILCDGRTVDIVQPFDVFQGEVVREYRATVRRRSEKAL